MADGARTRAGRPRWMKVIMVAAAVVVALLVLAMIVSGGEHGPSWHLGSAGAASSAPGAGR